MIHLIAIFSIFIFPSDAIIKRPFPSYGTPIGPYNPSFETCCMGKIQNLTNRQWNKCCGDEVYNQATELCCNGKLNRKENSNMCCGTTTYDTSRQMCCQDEVREVPSGNTAYLDCCGTEPYDETEQLCCYDGGFVIVNKTEECQNGCCGKIPYNFYNQVCCYDQNGNGNKVLDKEGGKDSCCGGQLIDSTQEICCNDKAFENPNNKKQCCGNEVIDTNKEACCYIENGPIVVPITNPGANSCCGRVLYNPNKETCCDDKVYEGDYQTTQCCYTRNNVVAYSVKTQLCCYNEKLEESVVVNKTNPKQDSCCMTKPFDSTKEVCCSKDYFLNIVFASADNNDNNNNSAVTSKPIADDDSPVIVKKDTPDATECCGNIAYSYSNGICCQANNQSKYYRYKTNEQYKYGCCGLKNYNTNEQICCNGQVTDRNQSNPFGKDCCNDQELYDTSNQICCVDWTQTPYTSKVYPTRDNVFCCGTETYDYRTELCCGNKIFTKKDNLQCCGNSSYDISKETCCGITVFKRDHCHETACCYSLTTDESECPNYPIEYAEGEGKKKKK